MIPTQLFDGAPKAVIVHGYSTSFIWPRLLQRKLDRYFDGQRVVEVLSSAKAETPIAKWMDVNTGAPKAPWIEIFRPLLETARRTSDGDDRRERPVIVLAQQSLQWIYGERTEGIRSEGDHDRIVRGADALARFGRLLLADGVSLVIIAMHIYKDGMEPAMRNERYALAELMRRKPKHIEAGPDVWTPTQRMFPHGYAADGIHPNRIGAEVMAHHWFEALLKRDRIEAPSWSRDESTRPDHQGAPTIVE